MNLSLNLSLIDRRSMTPLIGGILVAVAMPSAAAAQQKQPQAPVVDPGAMVAFAAGEYTRGVSTDEELGRYGDWWFVDQQPAHTVRLDAFSLDAHEVTVGEFALFLTYAAGDWHYHPDQAIERVDAGYLAVPGTADEPVAQVTWAAARDYCRWAGKRLPTEAEWERAARGVDGRAYPWGDAGPGCELATYFTGSAFCQEGPLAVGSTAGGATPEGVFDLGGNVAEWTADFYGAYPDAGATVDDPTGPDDGELRVVRGGGILEGGKWLRTTARWGAAPERRSADIGFRCAWDNAIADDGALRGALDPPPGAGRQPTDRPLVDPIELAAAVVEGLDDPGSVVWLPNQWVVLDRGSAEILTYDAQTWQPRLLAAGLGEPTQMASDGSTLLVADAAGRVLAVDPASGDVETLADSQANPRGLVADADGAAWITDDAVVVFDAASGEVAERTTALRGPIALDLAGEMLFVTTDGGGNGADTVLASLSRTGDDQPATLLDNETFQGALYPSHVDVADQRLLFVMRYRGFPNNGFLCRVDLASGQGGCETHTPPPAELPMAVDGQVVWLPLRNTVLRYDLAAGPPFDHLTPFTRPGGLAVSPQAVVWSDAHNGRLYWKAR